MKNNDNRVFIIAEAGVNHNGCLELAKKMVGCASDAGVDAVKFQTFNTEELVCEKAPKAEYQKRATGKEESQFTMLKNLELSLGDHKAIINLCKEQGIIFISSPFDCKSIEMLASLDVDIYKIPSGEITNFPYLRKIGKLNKKIIMSTGMADMKEVKDALYILMDNGTAKDNISLLHCNTDYPTAMKDVNLRIMQTIKSELDVVVGISDHSLGVEVPIAAVALGARIVEKHFTLDKNMEGPDHKASLDPVELKNMVASIRNTEEALGEFAKILTASELENKSLVRKSIVASQPIKQGQMFTEENITVKRPENGLSPMLWDEVLGMEAKKDFNRDEVIEL